MIFAAVKRGITCHNDKCGCATKTYQSSRNNLEYCSQAEEKLSSFATWPLAALFLPILFSSWIHSTHNRENRTPRARERAIYQDSYHWNEIIYCIKTAETPRPSPNGKTGVALSVYWNSQIRGPFVPPLSSGSLAPFLRFSPRRSFLLSSVPRVFGTSIDAL